MGSDRTGSLSRTFGVYDESSGLALRGTFVIGPDAVLRNSEVNFYNLGRNIDELVRKVEANVHLSKHSDEACPANWKREGDKTLKPSAALVGKVHEAMQSSAPKREDTARQDTARQETARPEVSRPR
jgi:NADH-dependent peroxiredoxin subunit C